MLERQSERQDEKAEKLEAYIRKYGAGQRAKQAHDRERKLERLQRDQVETMRDVVGPVMRFDEVERSGDIVVEARKLSKAFDVPLFRDLNLTVDRGECVAVIGPNGAGKTTLIKTLIGREKPDSGEVKLGHKVQVGYHDQGLQSLDPDTTVVRAVWPEDDPDWVEGDVRNLLARFGLTGELVFHTVGKLSGGEKAKAALARLCATSANLLVMDEPTNHLDIWSREALERSINEFEGTVLVVSHDRYFLNKVADRLVVLADGQARVIQGDYETYQHLREGKGAGGQEPGQNTRVLRWFRLAVSPLPRLRAPAAAKAKRKFAYRKAVDIEREIGELENEVHELEDLLGQPATWRDPVKAVGYPGSPHRAQVPAGNPVRALGDRARSKLVSATSRRFGNRPHARPSESPDHHPPRNRAHAFHAGTIGRDHHARKCRRSDGRRATCTATSRHSSKCWRSAALDRHPGRHLVLQELIHGPLMYPDDKGDRSHQLLDVFAALKCQYPDRVHMILGNHELSELTGRSIGKDGEGLNAKFRRGIDTAYGASAGDIHESTRPCSRPSRWRSGRRIASTSATRSPTRATSTRSTSSCSRPTRGRTRP